MRNEINKSNNSGGGDGKSSRIAALQQRTATTVQKQTKKEESNHSISSARGNVDNSGNNNTVNRTTYRNKQLRDKTFANQYDTSSAKLSGRILSPPSAKYTTPPHLHAEPKVADLNQRVLRSGHARHLVKRRGPRHRRIPSVRVRAAGDFQSRSITAGRGERRRATARDYKLREPFGGYGNQAYRTCSLDI